MNNQDFKISIEKPKKEFEHFLNAPNNRRIIFSGAFGSGKTWFLKEFFSDTEKYYCIRLTPVNYAASQNEDIFELVKFDILFHILREKALPEDLNFSKTEILQFPELLDPEKGLSGIIAKISRSGHSFYDLPDDVIQNSLQETQDDPSDKFKQYKEFRQKITQKKGSPYEHDDITNLIYTIITALKQSPKETILLIDDMDRIDPEHIFRILNVLAAHFDIDETENKFGFDKIILVCDIQNIRRVFRNRYGQDTDFSGYIDKFYSRKVFEFDNKEAVRDILSEILASVKVNSGELIDLKKPINIIHKFIVFILQRMILCTALNLRSIYKMYGTEVNLSFSNRKLTSANFNLLMDIIEVLTHFSGDLGSLIESVKKCANTTNGSEIIDQRDLQNKEKLGVIIPVLIYNNPTKPEGNYCLPGTDDTVGFYMPNSQIFNKKGVIADVIAIQGSKGEIIAPDVFPYLLEAIRVMQRTGDLAA